MTSKRPEGSSSFQPSKVSKLMACRTKSDAWSLMFRFGRHKFPVRIARAGIAGESPEVIDLGDVLGIAFNQHIRLVVSGRYQLADDAHGDLRFAALRLGMGDLGLVDADEGGLHLLAAGFTLADRRIEAVIDFARQQVLQGFPVAVGIGHDDHLVSHAGTVQKLLRGERGIGLVQCAQRFVERRSGCGDCIDGGEAILILGCRIAPRQRHDLAGIGSFSGRRISRLIEIARRLLISCAAAENGAELKENQHRRHQEE
ncbi:hypothetical protein RHECNPAF_3340027 [Rhizobium etli CNPAF512]|nr:hypothetical protein RHECNPAF_3340027 [Rhizobium etli CNPAF512]